MYSSTVFSQAKHLWDWKLRQVHLVLLLCCARVHPETRNRTRERPQMQRLKCIMMRHHTQSKSRLLPKEMGGKRGARCKTGGEGGGPKPEMGGENEWVGRNRRGGQRCWQAGSSSKSREWGMTCVWGGFNWGQMLLHNNTGFSAAYEVGWGRDEAGGWLLDSQKRPGSLLCTFLLVVSWWRLPVKKSSLAGF